MILRGFTYLAKATRKKKVFVQLRHLRREPGLEMGMSVAQRHFFLAFLYVCVVYPVYVF